MLHVVLSDSPYRKVARSRLSQLVAHLRIFRLFMKWKFDAYVLWTLVQWVQNWIVDRSTACDFTVVKWLLLCESWLFFQSCFDICFHFFWKTLVLGLRKTVFDRISCYTRSACIMVSLFHHLIGCPRLWKITMIFRIYINE